MKLPPEPVDCGATTDNCGNIIVWLRPDLLDDIINEAENGNLSWLHELKEEFEKQKRRIENPIF